MLFTFGNDLQPPSRDWDWFLSQITPKIRQALANEAYRILGNIDDVDDVIQEALIIGGTKCRQLRDEAKLFQWMYKIVRREAYAHQVKSSSNKLFSRLIDIFEPPPTHPEELLINKQESIALQEALTSLDEQAKQIVLLKTSTNMNLKEISLYLGLNYNTVRSKYRRSLDTLRLRLEDGCDEKAI